MEMLFVRGDGVILVSFFMFVTVHASGMSNLMQYHMIRYLRHREHKFVIPADRKVVFLLPHPSANIFFGKCLTVMDAAQNRHTTAIKRDTFESSSPHILMESLSMRKLLVIYNSKRDYMAVQRPLTSPLPRL